MKRASFTAVFLFLGAAGCIPDRDNLHDPSLVPSARLSVLSAAAPTEPCSLVTVLAATSAGTVAVSSRGACLALDASASRDPQHDPITALSFDFDRVDAEGDLLDSLENDPQVTGDEELEQESGDRPGPRARLLPSFLRSLPPDERVYCGPPDDQYVRTHPALGSRWRHQLGHPRHDSGPRLFRG